MPETLDSTHDLIAELASFYANVRRLYLRSPTLQIQLRPLRGQLGRLKTLMQELEQCQEIDPKSTPKKQ